MKKLMILVLVLLCSGCTSPRTFLNSENIVDYIKVPDDGRLTIKGTWRLKESLYLGEGEDPQSFDSEDPRNASLVLDQNFAGMFGQFSSSPRFKSKMVNATAFSVQQFRKNPEDIGLLENDIEVLTIDGVNQFRYTLIVIDPSHIKVASGGYLHTFEKIQDTMDEQIVASILNDETNPYIATNAPENQQDTILLLGIRSAQSSEGSLAPEYLYKTIVFHKKPSGSVDVSSAQDLYIPRRNELWKIESERIFSEDEMFDEIHAYPTGGTKDDTTTNAAGEGIAQVIHFVNENYISVEKNFIDSDRNSVLQTYAVDQLSQNTPLGVTMIAGDKGKAELQKQAENEAKIMETGNAELSITLPASSDWGISRRNGRWIFRSLIHGSDFSGDVRKAFDMNILPTTQVFSSNEFAIPWPQIKQKHPSAIDAVSAPNSTIIAIQDTYRLYFYTINQGVIADEPLQVVRIRTNDRIVMAEWGMDSTAQQWLTLFESIEFLPQSE